MRRPREKLLFDTAGSIVTPLQDLDGIITPHGLIYIRSHAGHRPRPASPHDPRHGRPAGQLLDGGI